MNADQTQSGSDDRMSDTTLVTASTPGELSSLEAAIMDACNELHDARAQRDAGRTEAIRVKLFKLIDRYDETDGDNHPNAAWARPNQRALALSAAGRINQAISAEEIALKYADNDRRREISLDNLADRCIRAGRYEEAVSYFLQAVEVAPNSVPVLMTGAQALYFAGMTDEADGIFAALLGDPAQLDPRGPLGAYLDCEERLFAMADRLPSLRALYKAWSRVKSGLKPELGGAS
ncbi:MAG: hypothetical protein DHS20C14_03040 [Phycisphaeraceae bacterium]|nr:MAG: hypothetical protein DHS20C14_03040 [Phycisphaeraceae bacterium]